MLVFLLLGAAGVIYIKAMEPFNEAEKIAVEIAKKEAELVTIDDFSIYNGTKTYFVVKGKDIRGRKFVVWIPEEKKDRKITVRREKDGITEEEARKIVMQKKTPKEIMSVKLGMENNIPLWEIYYRSNKDAISYYYIDFATGEMLKDIENL